MNTGLIIGYRYPNADPLDDYSISQEPGQEPVITYWNEAKLGAQPTTDQLRSWWLDAEKWGKKRNLRNSADAEYDQLLSPEGLMTRMERDEVIEKKAVERMGGSPGFVGPELTMSTKINDLRLKRRQRFAAVNNVVQGATETLEQVVERVRGISW